LSLQLQLFFQNHQLANNGIEMCNNRQGCREDTSVEAPAAPCFIVLL
jgi:hypothetical protein